MFVAHELITSVSFPVACARLRTLLREGWLGAASEDAYRHGYITVIRVGPLADHLGASKRVRVRFLDPVSHNETLTVGVRWEATGITGALFPVFDGDINLAPAGEQATRLTLVGVYRPPLDRLGATLDRLILHRLATATIRALLERIADAVTSSAPVLGSSDETAGRS